MTNTTTSPRARTLLNKVPEVALWFWVIKILATTVGETAADFLNTTVTDRFDASDTVGLTVTSAVMGALLAAALVVQFRTDGYVPGVYWSAVVLISVVGTLITDNMVDNFGVSLPASTTIFAVLLALTFLGWYSSERTLSIHAVTTPRREGWYWLTVLFTFALGTAAGDLVAEKLDVGYLRSALLFAAVIAVVYALHRLAGLGAVVSFWIAYVLTRPLGASIGDELSQSKDDGGLGLGTTVTSALFLLTILATVAYLTRSRVDRTETVHPDVLAR